MKTFSLVELEDLKLIELGRGKVISKKDLNANPGNYPVYSSAKTGGGIFGTWGNYDFNEEMITWSVDGGGDLFHRNKHKFSITNVGGFIKVLDKNKINTKYLYYALKNLHNGINFDWVKKAHPSVLRKEYNYIPVPSLQEQEKIVEKLDTFMKLKSNLISNIQMKYSMMNNFFDFNFSDINKFVNLEDLIVQIQYGTSKKSDTEGKYPVLGMGNLDTRGVINFNNLKYTNDIEEFNKYKLEKEDVLFNRTNSAELVGKSAVFNSDRDCIFAGYLIKIKCDPNKLSPHYLTMVLNSKFGKRLHEKFRTQSTGQANISGSKLKKYKIPYVEIGVQNEIIKKREMLLSKINSLEILIKSQQELLETLNKSVLKKEFSYE